MWLGYKPHKCMKAAISHSGHRLVKIAIIALIAKQQLAPNPPPLIYNTLKQNFHTNISIQRLKLDQVGVVFFSSCCKVHA